MRRTLLAAAVMTGVGAPMMAAADEGEIQTAALGTVSGLSQDGRLHGGFGAGVLARWGWTHELAVEATVLCERFQSLRSDVASSASLYYDAQRCTVTPALAYRHGARQIVSAAVGFGYRIEELTRRDIVADTNALIEHLPDTTRHILVARVSGAFERRFRERWTFGGYATAGTPLDGRKRQLDLAFGLLVGLYFYP